KPGNCRRDPSGRLNRSGSQFQRASKNEPASLAGERPHRRAIYNWLMQSLDLDVLERARDWRREGRRVWLLTVAQTFGASPRPPGSLAAIRDDGILVGSVSGGCIEDDLVARREEYAGRKPHFAVYGVTSEEARRFGLPCGGELEVIIEAEVGAEDFD